MLLKFTNEQLLPRSIVAFLVFACRGVIPAGRCVFSCMFASVDPGDVDFDPADVDFNIAGILTDDSLG